MVMLFYNLTFTIPRDHMQVSKIYWQMAWHALCWSLYVHWLIIKMSMLSQENSSSQKIQFMFKYVPKC